MNDIIHRAITVVKKLRKFHQGKEWVEKYSYDFLGYPPNKLQQFLYLVAFERVLHYVEHALVSGLSLEEQQINLELQYKIAMARQGREYITDDPEDNNIYCDGECAAFRVALALLRDKNELKFTAPVNRQIKVIRK